MFCCFCFFCQTEIGIEKFWFLKFISLLKISGIFIRSGSFLQCEEHLDIFESNVFNEYSKSIKNRSYLVLINFGKNSWLKIIMLFKKKNLAATVFCVEIPLSSIKFKPWTGTWGNGIHEGRTKYNCSLCQRFMRYDKETKIYNIYKICRDCPIRSHITGIS